MAIDVTGGKSRRTILAAGLGAAGAALLRGVARPDSAEAFDGDPLKAGQQNIATSVTSLSKLGNGGVGFKVVAEGSGRALEGLSGKDGRGLFGQARGNYGAGVFGQALGSKGHQRGGTGVYGFSTNPADADAPLAPIDTGVFGYSGQTGTSFGVWGRTLAGTGVYGESSTGSGLVGYSYNGAGVLAKTTTGIGLDISVLGAGTAMRLTGALKLSQCAGTATITHGTRTRTVTSAVPIRATSLIFATLQSSAGGTTGVQLVTRDTGAGTFTITLTATATVDCTVASLVISN